MIGYGEMILRLCLALVLGAAIGLERELSGRPAGLRTHILVSIGAALVMLLSLYGFSGLEATDKSRLAAGVVGGLGFIGAGVIMRDKGGITGLTTATTIWVSGMIGLACGNGFYLGAVITTFLTIATLVILRLLEKKYSRRVITFELISDASRPLLKDIISICDRYKLTISEVDAKNVNYGNIEALKLTASFVRGSDKELIKKCLQDVESELKPLALNIK